MSSLYCLFPFFFIAGFIPDTPAPYKIGDKATDFKDAIAALESGKTPSPETTQAIGCSIKAKK